jgi:peptide deformylase
VAVRPVLHYPADVLKSPAADAAPGAGAQSLARDLVDTMQASPACVGIAAPQIGVALRAFALNVTGHRKARSCAGLIVMLNPEIVEHGGAEIGREGCMSLPDVTGNVRRATWLRVEGVDPHGIPLSLEADAFEARAFQHEIDHLRGLLFLDRVVSVSSDVFPRKRHN